MDVSRSKQRKMWMGGECLMGESETMKVERGHQER